jgi:hypothetical protein
MAIKHFIVSDHTEQEMHQTDFTYVDFTIGFI